MGIDHGILCTWQTPDLIYRDQKLRARTAVWGMSQNAVVIHIVALVVTAGTSLPFNLLFGIRHAATYKKVKHERHSIRQILTMRNVAYQGRGRWLVPPVMHPAPGPAGPWMDPNMAHKGPWMDPNMAYQGPPVDPNAGGQRVHPNVMHHQHHHHAHGAPGHHHWNPNAIYSHGTGQQWANNPNGGVGGNQWPDPNSGVGGGQWPDPNGGVGGGQWVDPNGGGQGNDFQDQFVQSGIGDGMNNFFGNN